MLSFKRVALGSFFVAMLGVCANAALLAHWKLDEGTSNGEDVSGDAGLDETGVLNGTYDGGFFGSGNISKTGVDGVPSSAMSFEGNSKGLIAEPDPLTPYQGALAANATWQLEMFANFNANPNNGSVYSEAYNPAHGPNLLLEFGGGGAPLGGLGVLVGRWGSGSAPNGNNGVLGEDSNGIHVLVEPRIIEIYAVEAPFDPAAVYFDNRVLDQDWIDTQDPNNFPASGVGGGVVVPTDLGKEPTVVREAATVFVGANALLGDGNVTLDEVKVFDPGLPK